MSARVYATASQLEDWLDGVVDMPERPDALLTRASRRVDLALTGAWYPVDDNGMPTTTAVVEALRDAVCAQVAWWVETGDTTGSGAGAEWSSVSIGKLSLSRGGGSGSSTTAAPRRLCQEAVDLLTVAGLLPIRAAWWG